MLSNIKSLARCNLTTLFLALLVLVCSAEANTDQLDRGRQLLAEHQYDQALEVLAALTDTTECDVNCRGLAHFYSGACLYQLDRREEALSELRLSVRFLPKFSFPTDENLPVDLAELFQQARRETLCTVEISIATPEAVAFLCNGRLTLSYRLEDVVAGQPVLLEPSRYSPYLQAQTLVPGRVNSFILVWATGLVDTSLTLRIAQPGVMSHYDPGVAREDASGCYLEVEGRRVDFERHYYTDTLLTRLTVGNDPAVIALGVVEAHPTWHGLLRDLRRNSMMRAWSRFAKIASAVGMAAAGTVSILLHGQAEDQYDVYMEALPAETNQAYREYEHKIALRNIFGGFAFSFAIIEGVAILTSPKNKPGLLEEFEKSGLTRKLSLDTGKDYVGLKFTYSF